MSQNVTKPASDLMPQVGQVVAGKYRIDGVVGEGGFSEIFRAHNLELPALEVALKVLKTRPDNEGRLAKRFRREAELIAKLRGRHVVRLVDYGQTDQGLLFLAMELARGISIHDWIQATQDRPATRVADITRQVLKALIEAHALGIVHRDLKPPNIMLVDEPGETEPVVIVLDFGVAKILESEGDEPPITEAGGMVGTPCYTPPEQLLGQPVPASDLYALGHTMIEMLQGYPAYWEGNAVMITQMHMQPDPVPLGPYIQSSGLAHIIAKACEKPLQDRYQLATEMLNDLDRCRPTLEPVVSSPSHENGSAVSRGDGFVAPLVNDAPKDTVVDSPVLAQVPPVSHYDPGQHAIDAAVNPAGTAPQPESQAPSLVPLLIVSILVVVGLILVVWQLVT